MKFSGLLPQQTKIENDFEIQNVVDSSLLVKKGDVFVFDKNITSQNGEKIIADALNNGAKAVISNVKTAGVTYTQNPALSLIKWAKNECSAMPKYMLGVTGTNGKTSVVWFYRQIMNALKNKTATIGTLGVYSQNNKIADTGYTSPVALILHKYLNELAKSGINYTALEVSSHGLALHRVDGIKFNVAAFTNLSPDHRDFHGSMEAYAAAKYRLFSELLTEGGTAVIHITKPECLPLMAMCKARGIKVLTYGTHSAELVVKPLKIQNNGMEIELLYENEKYNCFVPLVGEFQTENIATAVAMAVASGASFKDVASVVNKITSVPGRMEVISENNKPTVVVDYAHTPDALQNAIKSLKPQITGKLWLVFGCGGDRDIQKRSQMGEIAKKYANNIIVTDDNPRTENPEKIRTEIISACPDAINIADRKEAISYAINKANSNDTILVAGKGHENGQIIGKEVIPFDDRKIVHNLLESYA